MPGAGRRIAWGVPCCFPVRAGVPYAGEDKEKMKEEKRLEEQIRRDRLGRRYPEACPGGRKRRRPRRSRPDTAAALSALTREARRRRMSYGTLQKTLTEEERAEIIEAWRAEHQVRPVEACRGCVYWRDLSATSPESGQACHFLLDRGRGRRRRGTVCLEYDGRGEPSDAARRQAWLGRRFQP